ncbi:MAG: ABC transporter substrate-binding protein [Syntrophales bacterium]|nr:ABC transporter substrate-binding protein [Syntrophales bacterium]MDY0045116.1 ABC transporter substrate-binding protein [Syntrophales bacterium]
MKRRILRWVLLLCSSFFLTGLFSLIGFVGDAYAADPVKIGFIGALSTPYGASNKSALEISIQEMNEAGGILGRPVKLVTEDWKREMPLAVAAYKKLVMNDGCVLVFTEGTEGSMACAQVGARLYPTYPHLMFANWVQGGEITDIVAQEYDKYKFVFRVYGKAADAFNPKLEVLELFKDVIGTKKVGLIIEDLAWTELYRKGKPGVAPSQKEYFEKNGVEVVYEATTDIKEKMFLPIFEKIAARGADTIYAIIACSDSVAFVKQWAQSGSKDLNIVLQSGEGSYAAFWDMTGGKTLGNVIASPEITIPYTERTKPFLAKLKASGAGYLGSTPGAYDGPWILKNAIEKAGCTDANALIKIIETTEIQRGFSKWAFDSQHDPKKGYPYVQSFVWGQFQPDGKYVLIFPEELRKITNPDDRYIPLNDLRKQAGR